MDHKNGIASVVLAAAIGSSACAGRVGGGESPSPDYENVYGISDKARDMVFDSVVKIETEYDYESVDGETKTIGTTGFYGSGVAIFDDETKDTYILTAGHLLPTKEQVCVSTGFFTQKCYKVLKKRMTVEGHSAKVVKHNETFDLGLIKLSGKFLKHHFTGKLAGDLEVGDIVIGAGYTRGDWKSFHSGYVVGEDVGEGLEDFIEEFPEAKKEWVKIKDLYDIFEVPCYVALNTGIDLGDSGSGLYALRNRIPELASIVQVKYPYKEGQSGGVSPRVLRGFVYGTAIADELGVYKR